MGQFAFIFHPRHFTPDNKELKHKIITKKGSGSGSVRLAQESGFGGQRLVLLDVVLLEAHGDPLGHLQVLLETRLGAAGLKRHKSNHRRVRMSQELTEPEPEPLPGLNGKSHLP